MANLFPDPSIGAEISEIIEREAKCEVTFVLIAFASNDYGDNTLSFIASAPPEVASKIIRMAAEASQEPLGVANVSVN